jgi:hypothetical protein
VRRIAELAVVKIRRALDGQRGMPVDQRRRLRGKVLARLKKLAARQPRMVPSPGVERAVCLRPRESGSTVLFVCRQGCPGTLRLTLKGFFISGAGAAMVCLCRHSVEATKFLVGRDPV